MSASVTKSFQQNVGKMTETSKLHTPFDLVHDAILVNIMTQAVIPGQVKISILQNGAIGHEVFDKFVR